MFDFSCITRERGIRRILCLGAHSDDIEIGCGASILRLIHEIPELEIDWVVLSADDTREHEARNSARCFLRNASASHVLVKRFRNGFFPYVGSDIKSFFETLKQRPEPDVVFTHRREDRHQDHRTVSDLTWNTFRNHFILEYEIPKYDGDLSTPNFYAQTSAANHKDKAQILLDSFTSQRDKHWFTADTFMSLARLRGVECNSHSGYAEAFHARKLVL